MFFFIISDYINLKNTSTQILALPSDLSGPPSKHVDVWPSVGSLQTVGLKWNCVAVVWLWKNCFPVRLKVENVDLKWLTVCALGAAIWVKLHLIHKQIGRQYNLWTCLVHLPEWLSRWSFHLLGPDHLMTRDAERGWMHGGLLRDKKQKQNSRRGWRIMTGLIAAIQRRGCRGQHSVLSRVSWSRMKMDLKNKNKESKTAFSGWELLWVCATTSQTALTTNCGTRGEKWKRKTAHCCWTLKRVKWISSFSMIMGFCFAPPSPWHVDQDRSQNQYLGWSVSCNYSELWAAFLSTRCPAGY